MISFSQLNYRVVNKCRLCGGSFYEPLFSLRSTGLANELYATENEALLADRFPLTLVMCSECKHIQLREIINPERLFREYIYQSGTSQTFQAHFEKLATDIHKILPSEGIVVEIGSNDGTLLQKLSDLKIKNIGVEPSTYLVEKSRNLGLNAICGYLDSEIVEKINSELGLADIVVGNNVFAHIDDLNMALYDVFKILKPDGIFIFEVSHVLKVVENGYFDTIYHEHMSYHSVSSLKFWLEKLDLDLFKVEEISTHGGSIRVFVGRKNRFKADYSVDVLIEHEKKLGILEPEVLAEIQKKVEFLRVEVNLLLNSHKGKVLFGYGAPAKVVTFLSEMSLENFDFLGIIDDNLEKQHKYLPGSGIQILPVDSIIKDLESSKKEGLCLIFPWNLGEELESKLHKILPAGSSSVTFFPKLREVKY